MTIANVDDKGKDKGAMITLQLELYKKEKSN